MENQLVQMIISSGIIGMIVTAVISRVITRNIERFENEEKVRKEDNFLMMQMLEKVMDLSELMARKLHDAGIINGDLERINAETQKAESEYHERIARYYSDRVKR